MSHVIALITVLSFLFLKPAISGDTLFSNQTLRDGKTIVSAKETFELGFFSPPNSTNRYLGIWYKKISDRLVVWVANRDNPVTDSSGFLRIADPGVLVLTDQSAKVIWSSSKSTNPETPRTAIAIAKLLDSGNLVMMIENPNSDYIQNNDNTDQFQFLWQSFDYPTDTLLPGMKLGVDSSKMTRKLTSWRNPGDPSTGAYSFRVDPNGFPEIILTNGLTTIYRSGPWNGLGFSGVPEMKPNNIFNFTSLPTKTKRFTRSLY
ncbi:hypothetical protein Sjap_025427 [Stephania japonica]|uniref:Bulb-type lectin domain-containing protein n=1 Tax=Stephania japonica TaxID=461633 RepID=A0AAP0E1S1_9MAGN